MSVEIASRCMAAAQLEFAQGYALGSKCEVVKPTSDGLKAFAEANPSALVAEPLPIYLNPAVRD